MVGKPKKKKKTKKILSPTDKLRIKTQNDHKNLVRGIFRQAGFSRVSGIADKEFNYDGQTGDIDDLFKHENVFVAAEYTITKSVGDHLKPKKILFDKMLSSGTNFLDFLKEEFPATKEQLETKYHKSKIIFVIIYCSRYDFEDHYKTNVPGPVYMDYPAVRYFSAVVDAIKISARHELLHFLGVEAKDVGVGGKILVSPGAHEYKGSILPEAHSNFDDGFKVVSFYIDPEALLKTAYVLRRDGWRDSFNLYQRMISKKKIEKIRSYLKSERRVFVNNIILTLPSDVKPLDSKGDTVKTSALTETAPVIIKLPARPNSVGVVDGQHRIFAYHETAVDDPSIASLRTQQNLLATGVIYPKGLSPIEREKFEAKLFLEINSTQTAARPQLKQAIGMLLDPFATESIAAHVLARLAKSGPLAGYVEQHFFDSDKLKTASIVSFALKPLVKSSGSDSIFSVWSHPSKAAVVDGSDVTVLDEYVSYCADLINKLLIAVKKNIDATRWTTEKKRKDKVLTTTYVNSFLILGRMLIGKGRWNAKLDLDEKLSGLNSFDFSLYHSSQYKRMAEEMYEKYFPGS